ncbi:MAG: hypothetical protein SFW36_14185 [Leptolyngbyaceae cyanobacterium bins.59]|nr:hypothetical protein [Leptolyngbyaceae cyanobacterium bins.59]
MEKVDALPIPPSANSMLLLLEQKSVIRCHILLPDAPRPIGAIFYQGHFYSYIKFYESEEAALKGAGRLSERGDHVLLTRIPKGIVLWGLEPDAQLANH